MRKFATVAGLICCLLLTACPGSIPSFRAGIAPEGGRLMFNSTFIYVDSGQPGPHSVHPEPLNSTHFALRSGDDVFWQIERVDCDGSERPSHIDYGVVPPCYREVVPPRPLEKGRAYFMDGWFGVTSGNKHHDAHTEGTTFVYGDVVTGISWRGYRHRTRHIFTGNADGRQAAF